MSGASLREVSLVSECKSPEWLPAGVEMVLAGQEQGEKPRVGRGGHFSWGCLQNQGMGLEMSVFWGA